MFCTKCGKPLPDNAKFCTACGAAVHSVPQQKPASPFSRPGDAAPAQSGQQPQPSAEKQIPAQQPAAVRQIPTQQPTAVRQAPAAQPAPAVEKKKKKGWIIAVVVLLLIGLLAAAGAFLYLRFFRSNGDYQKEMDAAAGYMEEENYHRAESRYKAALEYKPGDADANLGLAQCYMGLGDYEKAEETLEGFSPKAGQSDAYDRMMGAVQASPRITDISVDNFPEVKVEIAVDGDVDIDVDTVSLTEDGSSCSLHDVQRTGNGVAVYYGTDDGDALTRTVAAELEVNGYTLSVEAQDYDVPYALPASEAPSAAPSEPPSAVPSEAPTAYVADWGSCAGWYQNLDDSSEVMGVVWESPYLYLNTMQVDAYANAIDAIARHNMGQDTRNVSDILWDYAEDRLQLDMTDMPEDSWWEMDKVWYYSALDSGLGEDTIYYYDKVFLRWDGQMPEETGDDGYILPTDSAYISASDLAGMDKETVMLARNEIYARHGYVFKSNEIQAYFDAKSWYTPNSSVNASTFTTAQMNEYEKANLDVILNYEKAQGWK